MTQGYITLQTGHYGDSSLHLRIEDAEGRELIHVNFWLEQVGSLLYPADRQTRTPCSVQESGGILAVPQNICANCCQPGYHETHESPGGDEAVFWCIGTLGEERGGKPHERSRTIRRHTKAEVD